MSGVSAQDFRDRLNRINRNHGYQAVWELADELIMALFASEATICEAVGLLRGLVNNENTLAEDWKLFNNISAFLARPEIAGLKGE